MAKKPSIILIFASSIFFAKASHAGDYPFSGVYAQTVPTASAPLSADKVQLQCFLSFILTDKEGKGALYYIDVEKFATSHSVNYVKAAEYTCHYDPNTQIESCESAQFTPQGKVKSDTSYAFYQESSSLHQKAAYFLSLEDLKNWQRSGTKIDNASVVESTRCLDLSEKQILAYVDGSTNSLSQDETFKREYFSSPPSDLDFEIARRVKDLITR